MGGHGQGAVFCLFLTGCSCGAIVVDSSAGGAGGRSREHAGGAANVGGGGTGGGATGGAPAVVAAGGSPAGRVGTGGATNSFDGGTGIGTIVDPGSGVIEPRSGSVIDVQGASAEGHPASVESVRDTVHGVTCSVALAGDGESRCLPVDRSLTVRYTDAGCQNPIVLHDLNQPCAGETPKFALHEITGRCPASGSEVFAVGDAVVAPEHLYDVNAFGCNAVPIPKGPYFAATPSPATEWVAFEHHVKPVTGRLGVGYWTGSDGSQLIDGAWLLKEDVLCNSEIDESENERCVPTNRVHVDPAFYTDSTCTTKVAATFVCEAALLTATPQSPPDRGCRGPTISGSWFEAQPIDPLIVHTGRPGSCTPSSYGGFKYYAPGVAVVFDALPPIGRAHGGTGRIQRMFWTSEGKALDADGLYDTALASECHAVATSKGSVCEAVGDIVGTYFADAACTVPLYTDWPSCTAHAKFVRSVEDFVDPCNRPATAQPVRRFLGPHEGDVYSSSGAECDPSPAPPGGVLYDLSELIPPEEAFAPLEKPRF